MPKTFKEKTTKIVLWFTETNKFVGIDFEYGGYPYHTDSKNAYDFGTIEKANDYAKMFPGLKVGQLVSYHEFTIN